MEPKPPGGADCALGYVRQINRLSEDLLHCHGDLLAHKNIRSRPQLIRVIRLDLDKLTHALVEAKHGDAASVLRTFFGETGSPADQGAILARLATQTIDHIGFEIYEPAELVLYGVRHWVDQTRRTLHADMSLQRSLHFPASQAFQDRVGAPAGIVRVWLEVRDRILKLELFDIQRPADSALAGAPPLTHRNFQPIFGEGSDSGHSVRMAALFGFDTIWHYAFHVKSPADVDWLHEEMKTVSQRQRGISLAYAAPVHNPGDRSFHTKVVRAASPAAARMEVEFIADCPG